MHKNFKLKPIVETRFPVGNRMQWKYIAKIIFPTFSITHYFPKILLIKRNINNSFFLEIKKPLESAFY